MSTTSKRVAIVLCCAVLAALVATPASAGCLKCKVKGYVAAVNKADMEKVLSYVAETVRFEGPDSTAVLDRAAVGVGFTAYIAVGLSDHSMASQQDFEGTMRAAPDVRECHNITGVFEYLLRVEVADLAAYKMFHAEVLGSLPQVSAITRAPEAASASSW